MRRCSGLYATLLCWAALMFSASVTLAQCKITSVSAVSLTGLASYTPSTTAQSLSATLNVTVVKDPGNNSGCTSFALLYSGASPLLTNGASQLPYTISATSGGASILYASGTPSAFGTLPSFGTGSGAVSVSISVFLNIPALTTTQIAALASGFHTATLTFQVFNGTTAQLGRSRSFMASLTVNAPRTCTIGGSGTPTRGTAAVPVASNGRITNLAAITPTLPLGTTVACTGSGAVVIDLLSQNGRLTGPANSNPAFANTINYTASASVAGGTAASFTSSSGAAVQGTAGGTSGSLAVSIIPVDPGIPLIAGTYTDVLTVRITPQ